MFASFPFGALAQLVERLHGMQEVRSSTLLCSTIFLVFQFGGPFLCLFASQSIVCKFISKKTLNTQTLSTSSYNRKKFTGRTLQI